MRSDRARDDFQAPDAVYPTRQFLRRKRARLTRNFTEFAGQKNMRQ